MKHRLVLALVILGAAASVAVPFATASSNASIVRISAIASGLKYNTKLLHAKAGRITIDFSNLSQLRHNVRLEVGEKEFGGTKTIAHGTTSVTVTLKKGTYHFYCSVPGHEDAGMSGQLIVS